MSRRGTIKLIAILFVIVIALPGGYYVWLHFNESAMADAMLMNHRQTIAELAHSFPCPVNARDRNGRTPLHCAAEGGDRNTAEWLLGKGADVNAKTKDGGTPLHEAAGPGNREVGELLIAKGANINARSDSGYTALHIAVGEGRKEFVALLIAKGADVNAKNNSGETALQIAVQRKCDDVAEILRKAGAKE